MKLTRIDPPGVLKHPRFSRIITLEGTTGLAFFSSQAPDALDTMPALRGDLRAQYIYVMEQLELQLKAVGCSWDDVVVRRLFLTDIDHFYKLRAGDPDFPIYFKDLPTSTAIQVKRLLDPEWMIEVEIIAALPN